MMMTALSIRWENYVAVDANQEEKWKKYQSEIEDIIFVKKKNINSSMTYP